MSQQTNRISREKIAILILLAVFGYLMFRLFIPFITAILWAIILAVFIYPLQKWLCKKTSSQNLATFISTITVIAGVIIPLTFVLFQVSKELNWVYHNLQDTESMNKLVEWFRNDDWAIWLEQTFGVSAKNLNANLMQKINSLLNITLQYFTSLISNTVFLVANFIFTIFTLFFLLRNGEEFVKWLLEHIPATQEHKDLLLEKIKQVIKATLFGNIVVAFAQGGLAGLMFYLLQVPGTLVWTVMMIALSMVPMVGAGFVWLPVAIYFLLTGHLIKGILLILWGVFIVGLIDNVLRPILIGRQTHLPTIVTFYCVLGGIKLFGPLGVVLGPLIAACFLTLLSFCKTEKAEKTEKTEIVE